MAIRLNSGGVNFLEQLSGGEPDSRQPFTWAYWAMDRTTAHDSFGSYTFWGNGAFSNYITHRVASDTTTEALATHAGQDDSAFSVDQNVWHYWALVRDGSDVILYRDAVEVARVAVPIAGLALADNIGVGLIPGTGLNTYIDVAYMRLWEATLDATDLEAEMDSATPVITADLYDYWLFESGSLADGENGHDWTIEGSPTFIADPDLGGGATQYPLTVEGSITPSGTLVKQTGKLLAGGITPVGTLVKQAGKILAGAITPSGVFAGVKTALLSVSGSITPSGSLTKQTGKGFDGSITPTGALIKQTAKTFSGAITPSGALVKQTQKLLAGAITPAGALVKQVGKQLSGSITPTGEVAKRTAKVLAGTLGLAGALTTSGGTVTPMVLQILAYNTLISAPEVQSKTSAPEVQTKTSSPRNNVEVSDGKQ